MVAIIVMSEINTRPSDIMITNTKFGVKNDSVGDFG